MSEALASESFEYVARSCRTSFIGDYADSRQSIVLAHLLAEPSLLVSVVQMMRFPDGRYDLRHDSAVRSYRTEICNKRKYHDAPVHRSELDDFSSAVNVDRPGDSRREYRDRQ